MKGPGAPFTYFTDDGGGGGILGIFLGLKFWPKGILASMNDARIFLGHEKNTGMFLGIVLSISSNQQ